MASETMVKDARELRSEEDLDLFLNLFESGTLSKMRWTHAAHVAVAAAYLWRSDPDSALPRMRQSIKRHNEAVGTSNTDSSGYHETLTRFWLGAIDDFLRSQQFTERIHAVVA